jgi:VCBS repeat-containing protein
VPYVPDKGDSIEVQYDKSSLASGEASLPFIRLSENSFSEGESNGYKVGKLSLGNAEVQDASYTILSDSSDPDDSGPMVGAFSINTSTWEIELSNSSLIDKESQALHSLRVRASSAKYGDIERDITLIISDVIDAVPVASADVYRRSERIVDSSGNIIINGNLSFNDSGIDTSEVHTYTLNAPASEGLFQLNSDGSFTYTVAQADLSLTSGQSHVENLSYTLEDQSSNQSQANITITIDGANEAPILYQAINDQTVNITGGEQLVSIDSSSIGASGTGSGSYADLVDGNNGTVFTTSAGTGQAHHVEFPFSGTSYFEVSRIEIDGNHPVGNSVFQILSDNDDVLTREVLEIDNGSGLNIDFSTAVIGKKIKMIRPTGAVNSLGDDNIQIQEFRVYGFEVSLLTIDLLNHFSDADGDNLTFHVTDKFGEGPAPGWITIAGSGNQINAIPPAGADVEVGVLAADPSGDSAFTVFRITRTGGASSVNGPPIALLDIDDSQRGGLSLTRWGGNAPGTTFPDRVTHDEADEFLDQLLDESGVLIPYAFPSDFDGVSTSDGHGRLADGWNLTPSFENNKYARNGRLIPFINSEREYGEFYSGYFVPAKTGIYRFRTTTLDDVLRLLISPSEYFSDLEKIISGTIDTASMRRVMADTVRDQGASVGVLATYDLGSDEITNCRGTEFFVGQACGGPHDTSRFFQDGRAGYQHGYVYLEKGNVYATQVRFMEGGGSVAFDFEYDYKASDSSPWEGWKAIDASVVIPKEGADAYSNRLISASGSVNFDSSNLFYDSEQDILEYSARLVLPDGSAFVGPGQTSDVSEIGLSINITSGLLTGSLNSVYANAPVKPRIEFKATEKFSSVEKSATSLAIKLAP